MAPIFFKYTREREKIRKERKLFLNYDRKPVGGGVGAGSGGRRDASL